MDKKVQSIKWLYLTVFLLPVLALAQEKETKKEKETKIDEVVLVGYTIPDMTRKPTQEEIL